MLVAHVAIVFLVKLLAPGLDLFFLLLGTSVSGFDAILPILGLRDDEYHCGGIFHSVWPPVLAALMLVPLGLSASLSFLAGGILHLLADSTDERGRPWLHPLIEKSYGLAVFPYDFRDYVSNPVCVITEILSAIFVFWYVWAFALDIQSILLLCLLIPLFGAFVLHQLD